MISVASAVPGTFLDLERRCHRACCGIGSVGESSRLTFRELPQKGVLQWVIESQDDSQDCHESRC
jgi:hypothetical protein